MLREFPQTLRSSQGVLVYPLARDLSGIFGRKIVGCGADQRQRGSAQDDGAANIKAADIF